MSSITVALDAGHGGSDSGAVYKNRKEKDYVLRLTRAVGQILENNGINVFYVRTDDEYETPFKKATDANNAGADYFVSIHRNSSERPNQYSGVETLVYSDDGIRAEMARNINEELEAAGFKNLGVTERPNLVVLKRTRMPAVLVEVGFINSDEDNRIFDQNFNQIAQGIADGIMKTLYSQDVNFNEVPPYDEIEENSYNNEESMPQIPAEQPNRPGMIMPIRQTMEVMPPYDNNMTETAEENAPEKFYRVQVGAYRDKSNAERMLNSLLMEGFPAFMIYEDGYYKVQSGAFRYLYNAVKMERRLRRFRYNTYIVYS
ncbi:MAG: N-acetylmuramoyl-L-alanine amidase [Lachnospira sp.]|nr:N-acetylmuramoyl-L-alanine amidase [Lachnospira sp.]